MDIEPGDIEVYAHYGLALHSAQVLEGDIINLVRWTGIRDLYRGFEEPEADSAKLFRMTMGRVKAILVSRRPDVAHLDELLLRAVRLRNFLVHDYFHQRVAAFMTDDGKNQMIEELNKAAWFFQDAGARLRPLTMQIVEAMVLDSRMPEIQKRVLQAGFGDPLPGL